MSASNTQRTRFFLAAGSGLLLTAAFPRLDQGWLAWIALVPLILSIRRANVRQAFRLGLAFGTVHFLTLIYWVVHSMDAYGGLPFALALAVLILLCLYLALYPALFAAGLVKLAPGPLAAVWLAPVIWVATEYLRGWIFTGFPWELAGYSQYRFTTLIQVADLTGIYGLSALVVFGNTVAAMIVLNWADARWQKAVPKPCQVKTAACCLLALVLACLVYGKLRLEKIDRLADQAPTVTVAVIQGNVDQAIKWDPQFQILTTVKYRDLSLAAGRDKPDLIVWPETATPFFFGRHKALSRLVIQTARQTKAAFLIGSPARKTVAGRPLLFNRAYLIMPDGEIAGTYDKTHLVPFGEYVPLKKLLFFIDTLVAQAGNFHPGKRGHTIRWNQQPIGVQICYEVIFPELSRALAANGAQILVNLTNDAWFGASSAAYQHFSMAVLRAIETRRPLVRAANTGISGFIDPGGRILAATDLFTDKVLIKKVPLSTAATVYTRLGDWLATICLTITLLKVIMPAIRQWIISRADGAKPK